MDDESGESTEEDDVTGAGRGELRDRETGMRSTERSRELVQRQAHRKGQIPLGYPGRRQVRSWTPTGPRLVADLQRAGIWHITPHLALLASRSATGLQPASDLSPTRIA